MSVEDTLRRIRNLLEGLDVQPSQGAAQAAQNDDPITLGHVKSLENRFMTRLQASESFMVSQLDEATLATAMLTGIFVITCFYVFYFLMDNLLRARRCRCPDLSGWHLVVEAAKQSLAPVPAAPVAVVAEPVAMATGCPSGACQT